MNTLALSSSRRVRAAFARERATLLDHPVSFLIEDSWRSPWSTDSSRPSYRGRPYPVGKQAWAWTADTSAEQLDLSLKLLIYLQSATQRKVSIEVQEATAVVQRRLRAAQKPLAVIEPQSSLPGPHRTIEELEKRCRLPIEEIRGCFRQGRRSPEQQETRAMVEDAVRAVVKHHRMVHPVIDQQERYGRRQREQARGVWREFTGHRLHEQVIRQRLFETFGPVENEVDFSVEHGPSGRVAGKRRYRQIVPRLAEALKVSTRTIERVLSETSQLGQHVLEEES
jgi:hypothetical protein